MTDWKVIPKIDAHIHLMPPDVIAANQGYGDRFVDFGRVEDYLALMERFHIEAACIMPFNDPYMLSMDAKVASVHDNLISMCGKGAEKLFCFADIDLGQDADETIGELERVMGEPPFLGIKMHPTNAGYPVDGDYYDRIFDWANSNNLLVELHSYPRTHIRDDVCSPLRIQAVLKKYPRLRLSIAHMGGFQWEALRGLDVYLNFSAVLPDWVNGYGLEKTNAILRELGTDRLVFATDYPDSRCLKPEEIYGKYFELLGKMDFSQEEAERICKGNALRMLGG